MTFLFAFRNLLRNKRRSFSTGLAICVGFIGLNLLGAYIYRSKMALDTTSVYASQRGHYTFYKKDSLAKYQVNPKDFVLESEDKKNLLEALKTENIPIAYTSSQLSTAGLLSNGTKSHPVVIYGFEPEAYKQSLQQPELLQWAKDWILPSQLENLNIFIQFPDTISITKKIAEIMGFQWPLLRGDSVQIAGQTFAKDLNAINAELGASHTTGLQFLEDTVVLMPLAKVQELLGTSGIESISIYLQNNSDLKSFGQYIEKKFNDPLLSEKFDYYRFDDPAINQLHSGSMGFLYVMGGFFLFLICTAVSLTIINSLTMGIIERTREIGTLRAIGFKSFQVVRLFVLENIILGFMSMSLGVLLSFAIATTINKAHIMFFPPGAAQKIQFILNWNFEIALSVFFILFFVSTLSSWFVVSKKLKSKLIHLINDSETSA